MVAQAVKLSPEFQSDTLFSVGLASCGGLLAALYMSLPWTRSYVIPKPPRKTVLPSPVMS